MFTTNEQGSFFARAYALRLDKEHANSDSDRGAYS